MHHTISQVTKFLKILEAHQEVGLQPLMEATNRTLAEKCLQELTIQANSMSIEEQVKVLNIMCVDHHYYKFKAYWLYAVLGGKEISNEGKQKRVRDLDIECRKDDQTPLLDRFERNSERALISRFLRQETEGRDLKDTARAELEVSIC